MIDIKQYDPDKLINNVLPQLTSELRSIVGNGADPNRNIQALTSLQLFCNRYYAQLSDAYDRFTSEAKGQAETIAEKQAVEAVRLNSNRILEMELQRAVYINTEFQHQVFYQPLLSAVYDPRTIKVSVTNGRLDVKIDLKTTAGELKDWSQAVVVTRRILDMGKSKEPKKSHMWEEKFYKVAREGGTYVYVSKKTGKSTDKTELYTQKYWDTIYTRFDNCKSKAPYWYILNYGMSSPKDGEMKSDGKTLKGRPYPVNIPTHFVEKAINFMKSFYQQQYRNYYVKVESEIAIIQRKYQKRFDQWDKLITAIERSIAKEQERLNRRVRTPHDPLEAEIRLIRESLGEDRFARADLNRIRDLAQGLKRGEDISKRLYLGGGVSARTIRLVRKARGY